MLHESRPSGSWLIFDVSQKSMIPTLVVILLIGGVVALVMWADASAAKARRERVYKKYGPTEVAERIIKKTVWVGETAEQLRDSFGNPLDIDEKVLKTKRREIWKYVRKGKNRYGLKFTVENGVLVGWDEKM
jgi:hypothetical protein